MKIDVMTISDYEEAYALWANTAGMGMRSLDDSKAGIDKFLKRNPTTSFVCRVEGVVTGVIICGHDGRRGYIYHTAVSMKHRELGIGRALVEAALQALEDEDIKKAALVVFKSNHLGNAFWSSVGFEERDDLIYRNRVIDELNM